MLSFVCAIFITDLTSHFRVAFSLCFKMSSVLSYENEMIYKTINVQENLSSIKRSLGHIGDSRYLYARTLSVFPSEQAFVDRVSRGIHDQWFALFLDFVGFAISRLSIGLLFVFFKAKTSLLIYFILSVRFCKIVITNERGVLRLAASGQSGES